MAKKKSTAIKKRPKPAPKCKAILLCDMAIIEAETRKPSIIGVFNRFQLSSIPGATRPFSVFLQLISGIGEHQITIEIHDLREDKILARAQITGIRFKDRITGINVIIPVPALHLTHSGAYDFVVMADGQEIDRQQFSAAAKGEEDEPDSDEQEA